MNFSIVGNGPFVGLGQGAPDCALCGNAGCAFRGFLPPPEAIRFHDLERGQHLDCREGACLRFWSVIDGCAATSTWFRDGRRQILSIERPGDTICGSMARENSEQRLEALTDCRICEIDLSPWADDLLTNLEFLTVVFRLLHARLEKTIAHLSTMGRLDSHERVTYFLADMAARRSRPDQPVTLPMSREDIADYLGLNADSVSRVMSRIRKSKLVRFTSPTEYTVPDMDAVARRLPVAIPKPADAFAAVGGPVQ